MNIYDIAKLARVSSATVSRVINGSPHVSGEKRARVQQALREHNYVPNASARTLAGASTKTVAVLTEDIRHLNFSIIAYEVEQQASLLGYNVFVCNTSRDPVKQQTNLKMLIGKNVDGLVILGSSFSTLEIYGELDASFSKIPIILFNNHYEGEQAYHVYGRVEEGIAKAMDYLHSLGHTRIVFIKDDNQWPANLKHQTYLAKMREFNLPTPERQVFHTASGFDSGIDAINFFEENGVEYSAVLGCDDITAIGVVRQLKQFGKKVPADVSVIGQYDTIYAKIAEPALTTIDNRISKIAQTISRVLNQALTKTTTPRKTYISPNLIIRDSTACPPGT